MKLDHIALQVEEPAKAAEYYKEVSYVPRRDRHKLTTELPILRPLSASAPASALRCHQSIKRIGRIG